MNKEEILAMEAGQELNKLVAEQIFGKKVVTVKYLSGYTSLKKEDLPSNEVYEECYATVFGDGETALFADYAPDFLVKLDLLEEYSTDISAAWQVVEKMIDKSYSFHLEYYSSKPDWTPKSYPIRVYFSNWQGVIQEEAKGYKITIPEAICKAALLATLEKE